MADNISIRTPEISALNRTLCVFQEAVENASFFAFLHVHIRVHACRRCKPERVGVKGAHIGERLQEGEPGLRLRLEALLRAVPRKVKGAVGHVKGVHRHARRGGHRRLRQNLPAGILNRNRKRLEVHFDLINSF